ncbi:MAG TPA: nitrite/sulfite reductase [Pyrinomonadaceae bacterium]|nr:nitrite/sulfite reductase [Pyrinomonadaceae bacterium]
MNELTDELRKSELQTLATEVREELANYEEQIRKYRAGEVDETKMQKLRLHFGTYAQRQEGVQMQRIKIPGGFLSGDQLARLADAADRFGSGFIHFTTREDAQIYYVKLEEAPDLLRYLATAGITSREACGNTVRNITACYRAGTSATESFNVQPYADALFRYLVRNKYNQNLGRKFKITFEGCADDHSGLRIHDIGLWAVNRTENGEPRRGFRVYLGGGLGAGPQLAHLYTDFLPAEELFNLATATLRLFDRYGERKARMKARMKFLIQTLGWDAFRAALDEERERVGPVPLDQYLQETDEAGSAGIPARIEREARKTALQVLDPRINDPHFQSWVRDSVIEHQVAGFRGVHVRIKLGDLTADRARSLAAIVRRFSSNQLRISIEQNIYLPWVREERLWDLYIALGEVSLAERGAGTITDVTTCPGSDTCRLGIASAKGLGNAISNAFNNGLAKYSELARPLRVKISGCPNGCAHHSVANIGFYAAALSKDDRSVPAHFVTVGGRVRGDDAQFGALIGKFPAKNCVKVTETLLGLYEKTKLPAEDFDSFVARTGTERLKEILEPLRRVPLFEQDRSFYEDFGHEHEHFAVQKGIKGECAGSTVAETIPTIDAANEWLAQAEALIYHKEYEHAVIAAYEAAAAAARVPLYERLVDPFTADEALWEFENLFVLSGQTQGAWEDVSSKLATLKEDGLKTQSGVLQTPGEVSAQAILNEARSFVRYCAEGMFAEAGAAA